MTAARLYLRRLVTAVIVGVPRRDERGEIPANVAWIAGLVVLALAVIAIITAITKSQASSIVLH